MEFKLGQFMYSPKRNLLIAEASELGLAHTPQSIQVKSDKTGRQVQFALSETTKDREGEVTGWVYKPTPIENLETKVIIYND